MLLSIGMIVKNEQRYLRQCLEGLKQILDNVDSELIIVDTGSTDDTVAIAKEFTDKVFHFEWCNDFAAARNVSLEKSKGEWFMFIDGDEIIEDASEMIEFFNSGEYKRYTSATYIQRNYNNEKREIYSDFYVSRMCKRDSETHFEGIIHEALIYNDVACKMIGTVAHHFGYMSVSKAATRKKAMRNIELLLEEAKTADIPMRSYIHLSQAYCMIDNYEEAEKYMLKAIEDIDSGNFKNYDKNFDYAIYLQTIKQYRAMGKYDLAIDMFKRYVSSKKHKIVLDIDAYAHMILVYSKMKKHQDVIVAYNQYVMVCRLYEENKLSMDAVRYYGTEYFNDIDYRKFSYIAINSYMELGDYKNAGKLLNEFKIENFDGAEFDLEQYIHTAIMLMKKKDDYTGIQALINHNNGKIRKSVENYITVNYEHYQKLMGYLSDKELIDGKYSQLIRVRVMSDKGEDVSRLISSFCDGLVYNEVYSDALYYMLKNKITMREIVGIEGYQIMLSDMEKQIFKENEILNIVYEYVDSVEEAENFIEISFVFYLYNILLNNIESFAEDKRRNIIDGYSKLIEVYLVMAYNPDMLNDECIAGYVPDVQFAYYLKKVYEECDNGEFGGAVKNLKKALRIDNRKKDVINIFLEDIKSQMKETEKKPNNEFEEYAYKVKTSIIGLLNAGDAINARKFLEAYKRINANDADIVQLERRMKLLEDNI